MKKLLIVCVLLLAGCSGTEFSAKAQCAEYLDQAVARLEDWPDAYHAKVTYSRSRNSCVSQYRYGTVSDGIYFYVDELTNEMIYFDGLLEISPEENLKYEPQLQLI